MVQVSKAFGTSTHSAGMSRVTLAPCTWILLFPYVFLMDSSTGLIQLAPGSPGLTSVHSATGKALKTSCSRGQGTPCTNAKRTYETRACASKLYVQAHGDHHNEHGHGHPLGVMHATTTAPIEIEEKAKVKSGETFVFPAADRGGGLKGGGGVSGGGWGGGGGDGEGEGDEAGEGGSTEETGLAANKRRKDKIKGKVDKAIRKGKIPKECSKAYAELLKSPTMAFLCKNDGWRARLLGDINFMSKLWIELGTGTVAQALAEYQRRGKEFIRELDFVMADTLTSLFANFAAVWLSCPTVAVKALPRGASRAVSTSSLQRFFSSCPTNAFQTVTNSAATGMGASKGYTLYQRGGALLMPMPKLFAIGFGATLGGYGLIAALGTLRRKGRSSTGETGMEDVADQSGPTIPVFRSGLAIGSFLAVSTNLRYQFIAGGLEQRVFDKMRPGISSLASTAIRSGNLYFGSLTIVDWLRFLGLQSH